MNKYLSNPLFWLHYFRLDHIAFSQKKLSGTNFFKKYNFPEDKFESDAPTFTQELYKEAANLDDVTKYHRLFVKLDNYLYLNIRFCEIGEYMDLKRSNVKRLISLGYDDPHFHLPVFRWEELLKITKYKEIVLSQSNYQNSIISNFDTKYLPLLLLKFASCETINQTTYETFLQEKLTSIEVFPENEISFLTNLITTTWYSENNKYKWQEDKTLGWINDYHHSHRNPLNKKLKTEDFQLIKKLFFAVEQTTIFRKRQQQTHQCKGYLGGSHHPFIKKVTTNSNRIACCDQLVCFFCHHPVKTWDGYWVAPYAMTSKQIQELYDCDSPNDLPFVKTSSFGTPRLYACRCWADGIQSHDRIGFYEGTASWDCGGHEIAP